MGEVRSQNKTTKRKKFEISRQKQVIGYNNYGVLIKNFINDFFSTF